MIKIAIITAMDSEYRSVSRLCNFKQKGKCAETEFSGAVLQLIKSGIGKVNAALATQKACDDGADLIITTGLAGGIDGTLVQGDVVLADRVCYHDVWCGEPNLEGQVQELPLYFEAQENLLNKITAGVSEIRFKRGLIVSGDQFLTDSIRLEKIKKAFPTALAVDMESAAVAQVCYLNNRRPFLSLRIISDVAGKTNQKEEYNRFWQNVPDKAAQMVEAVLRALVAE